MSDLAVAIVRQHNVDVLISEETHGSASNLAPDNRGHEHANVRVGIPGSGVPDVGESVQTRDELCPRFSIVIPCYNESGYLADTLKSLRAQTFSGAYEIIVVDNNCTDDTADIARALGARVVSETHPGVCWARQRGTEESSGTIVISADADTTYAAGWLTRIDRSFGSDEGIVAVAGPCQYVGGPLWGRLYSRILFGAVNVVYRITGRLHYITATNIAFRRSCWSGYDVHLTQGGDELDLLRNLRPKGRVLYDHTNPTYTSSRRLTRGIVYGFFVTLLVYYLLAYFLNRLFKRPIIGAAPAYRSDRSPLARGFQAMGIAVASAFLLILPFPKPRHYVLDDVDSVVDAVMVAFTNADRE